VGGMADRRAGDAWVTVRRARGAHRKMVAASAALSNPGPVSTPLPYTASSARRRLT